MRIHVTGLRGIPGVMGGIESHCEELLPRIKARNADLDITVLCRAPYVDGERRVHRGIALAPLRSEEHTSELQSLMRISYAVFCLKKKTTNNTYTTYSNRRKTIQTQE